MQFVMLFSILSVMMISHAQQTPRTPATAVQERYFVALMPQHKAGARVGLAVISPQKNGGTVVEIRAASVAGNRVRAYVSRGNCSSAGAPVAFALKPLRAGYSATTLRGIAASALVSGRYAIIVDSDPRACGELQLLPTPH